jgi:hypothetical protein
MRVTGTRPKPWATIDVSEASNSFVRLQDFFKEESRTGRKMRTGGTRRTETGRNDLLARYFFV